MSLPNLWPSLVVIWLKISVWMKNVKTCKYKTGRHNREMGDRSSHAMLLVLARSVGHGETGFRLRSSVFATPLVQYLMSYLFHSLKPQICIYLSIYFYLFIYLSVYIFWWLKHLRACYVGNQPCFCACENVMLHWIWPVPRKRSTCLQDRSCICNAPPMSCNTNSVPNWPTLQAMNLQLNSKTVRTVSN